MSHLGDRVAAFVDGQLTPESAERATAHLAACRPCRDLVELERLTKARLGALAGPAPSADLVGRLLAMGGPSGPLPPRSGYVPGTPRPATVPVRPAVPAGSTLTVAPRTAAPAREPRRTPSTRPSGRPAVLNGRRGRLAVAVAGALSVVGVGVAGVGVAGAGAASAPGPVTQVGGSGGGVTTQLTTVLLPGQVDTADWFQQNARARSPLGRFAAGR